MRITAVDHTAAWFAAAAAVHDDDDDDDDVSIGANKERDGVNLPVSCWQVSSKQAGRG